jgi:hypothetical protein
VSAPQRDLQRTIRRRPAKLVQVLRLGSSCAPPSVTYAGASLHRLHDRFDYIDSDGVVHASVYALPQPHGHLDAHVVHGAIVAGTSLTRVASAASVAPAVRSGTAPTAVSAAGAAALDRLAGALLLAAPRARRTTRLHIPVGPVLELRE